MDDRRKHARFKSLTIMQYKEGFLTPSVDTSTKDISLGGVCFFSNKKIKLGQIIKIKLFYDTKSSGKCLKGKVVWSTEFSDNAVKGFLNGLTFIR